MLGIRDTEVFKQLMFDCIDYGRCSYSVIDNEHEFRIMRHQPVPRAWVHYSFWRTYG